MPEIEPTDQFQYTGPPELRADWNAFAKDYVGDGASESRIRNLELLNELVFRLPALTEKTEADPVKRAKLTAQAITDFLKLHGSNGNYESLRTSLLDVVRANSVGDLAGPLNKMIVNNLAHLWLSLEESKNLPVMPESAGLQKTPEWEAHQSLLRSPEGGLVSGVLLAGVEGALKAQSMAVARRYRDKGVTFNQVYSLSFDRYKSSLFRFEGDKEAGFLTYLTMRLKYGLPRDILGEVDEAVSLDAEFAAGKKGGDGGTRYDLIPDEKSADPLARAILSDDKAKIEDWLRQLPERYADVIRLRFGLGEAEYPHTLEEVAEIFGVSRQAISQNEVRAMTRLRKMAGAEDIIPAKPKESVGPAQELEVLPEPIEKTPKEVPIPPAEPIETPDATSTESVAPPSPQRKIDFDIERARTLAEENAGARLDLVQMGVSENIATRLDAILSQKSNGTSPFGIENELLRISQQETLEKESLGLHASELLSYAVLPGGNGKTRISVVMCAAAKDAGYRSVYIVPSILAAEGVRKEFEKCRPDISIGRVYDDHAEFDKDVTVIVYNSLYRHFYKSLLAQADGQEYPFNLRDHRLIVADEAHAYLTELAKHIFENADAVQFALTATDKYYEGKEVKNRFKHEVNRVDLDQAIMRKEILRPKYRCVETKVDLGLDEIYDLDQRDELYSREIEQHVNVPQWNQVFVDLWRDDIDPDKNRRIAGEKTFVHCAGIQHAKDMADRFNEQLTPLLKSDEQFRAVLNSKGIDPDKVEQVAAHISHKMSPKARQELLEKYNRREILVLTSSKMLIESVDDPGTSVIMNAVPTYSRVRAAQRAYRGSRTSEGKDSWYIYEALPANWETSKYAPVLAAEAFEDPQVEGIRGTPRSKPVRAAGTEIETAEGYKVHWEYADIAEILNRLYLIRQRQQGLDALDPDWLAEYDNQRGRYLEALRLRAGLSRRDAAEKIGVSDGTIFNYERGRGFQDMKPASKSGLGVTRFIELIRPCYNTTAEEETRLLHLFLPALDPEKFALIPEEDRPAVLLKTFRIRAGVEQKSVAKALGRDDSFQATLSAWERRGQNRFNRAFLDGTSVGEFVDIVTPLYRLSAKESEQLLHTLLPGLNPSWLTKQPEDRQLGLYLNALRRRGSSYSYEEMIERLGVNFNWEKRGGIDPSKLPIPFNDLLEKLKESYKLSDREVERITHMVLPALDPKKYALIPEEKKLGELLAAFRKRASLRQDVAGVKIGEIFDAGKPEGEKCGPILFGTMSGWESRVAPPLSQNSGMKEYVSAIMEAYKLSEAERGQLLALTLPPLSPTWLDTQPAKQQAGFMLMAYRQLLGQKRQETAEQLGIKPEKLGEYELSDRLIPSDVFEKAVTYFRSKCGKLFNEGELRSRFESSGIAFGSSSPEENDNERGIYLRELRERSQLPLEEAANRIGVSKGALHNYENGGGFESVRHQQGSRMGAAKFTEAVSEVYKTNPEESTKLLYLLLPALDPKWQERTPLEERLPHLLKAYRLRVGLEISEAGEKMGISPNFASTLGQWEAGNSRPDRVPPSDISIGKFVKDLTATYNLNEKESSQLLEAFFPALNKEWLYWQPQEKQLGLLLKSYRLRGSTLTRVEAEKQLGFSLRAEKTPGDRIAASRIGIPLDEIIARFKTLYDLSEAEALDLKSRISQTQTPPEDSKKDGIPEWSTLKSRRESLGLTLQAAATSMGIEWSELANWERRSPPLNRNNGVKEHILDIIHAYDIPADQRDEWIAMVLPPLSPEWLQTQPEKQRTGFMLMAYRQHTGLIREEFAKHIGTTEQVLGRYESGAAAIPEAIFENAVRFLGQRCPELFDEQQFRDIFSSSQGSSAGSVPPKIKPRRGIDPNSDHIKKREDRPYS